MNSQVATRSSTSVRSNKNPTSLDNFERLCKIVSQHLRWLFQLSAIICFFAFADSAVALQAAPCILAVGNAQAIKRLIGKIPDIHRH